jgi:Zn-dependent protease
MNDIGQMIADASILALPILVAVTGHELAHAYAADRLGDPTPRLAGRITLNPIKHLDPIGTLVFLLTRTIGWAKPVPINPANFRHYRRDNILVSAAGPAMNLILAACSAVLFHLVVAFGPSLGRYFMEPLVRITAAGVILNVGLAVFNLVPIPPLDGSHILEGFLPDHLADQYRRLRPYGFILLLALILTDMVDIIVIPVIDVVAQWMLGIAR